MEARIPRERYCLYISEREGERGILLVKEWGVFDNKYRVIRREGEILIPLTRSLTEGEMQSTRCRLESSRFGTEEFKPDLRRRPTIEEVLKGQIPSHLMGELPRSMPIIGDIAIVEISEELSKYKEEVGKAILTANPNLKTVLKKVSKIKGTHRTRKFEILAGEERTETVHREYGCTYNLDLAEVYFNPRLGYERNRISNSVTEGETILDMFAGVGPFSIQIAKRTENTEIFATDINPKAVEYLRRNIEINNLGERVTALEGDVRSIVDTKLRGEIDRIIMNLPGSSEIYIPTACRALKRRGGIIHYYQFAGGLDAQQEAEQTFIEAVQEVGRKVDNILNIRKVLQTAPREWQVAVDARVY